MFLNDNRIIMKFSTVINCTATQIIYTPSVPPDYLHF